MACRDDDDDTAQARPGRAVVVCLRS
jgi:hypothetical protein